MEFEVSRLINSRKRRAREISQHCSLARSLASVNQMQHDEDQQEVTAVFNLLTAAQDQREQKQEVCLFRCWC